MWLKTAVQHLWQQECSVFTPVMSVCADTPLDGLSVREWVLVPRWLLGTVVQQNLKWDSTMPFITKKAQQRMCFLWQLENFRLLQTVLLMFNTAIMESIITSSITVLFGSATLLYKWRLRLFARHAELSAHSPLSHTRTPPEWRREQEKSWLTSPTQVMPFSKVSSPPEAPPVTFLPSSLRP